jgi:hypothetical protein
MFDEYVNQTNQDKMIANQLSKLTFQRPSRVLEMFPLSWTVMYLALSIIENGKAANYPLAEALARDKPYQCANSDIAALSIAINCHFARMC